MAYISAKELQNGFQIQNFYVYPAYNKIELKGQTVTIEPKVMQVLCFLVENRGQVVSRELIAESLWPNSVVSYDVITRTIFELRKVFKDSAKTPEFIETISRKGYCFICPVLLVNKPSLESHTKPSRITRSVYIVVAAILLALIATFTLYIFFFKNSKDEASHIDVEHKYTSRLLTFEDTRSGMPAINFNQDKALWVDSPLNENGDYQLILFDIESNRKKILLSSRNEIRFPHWSRNENQVYFASCTDLACELKYVDIDSNKLSVLHKTDAYIVSFDVSSKENQLIYTSETGAGRSLYLFDLTSDVAKEIPLNESIVSSPIFDVDDKRIFYSARDIGKTSKLYQYEIEEGKSMLLSDEFYSILSVANKAKNKLWVSAKKNGKFHIWDFNVATKQSVITISELGNYIHSELNTSGVQSALILKKWRAVRHVEKIGLPEISWLENVNKTVINLNASVSNGITDFVYFVSNRTGGFELWRQSADSSEQITQLNATSLGRPLISFDQTKVAIISKKVNENVLYIVDVMKKKVIEQYTFSARVIPLNWSKDNSTLYLSSNDTGSYSILAYKPGVQTISLVAENAGVAAFDDPQSNGVYFIDLEKGALAQKSANGDIEQIVDLSQTGAIPAPGAVEIIDGWLYFIRRLTEGLMLSRISINSGEVIDEFAVPNAAIVTQIGRRGSPFIFYDIKKPEVSQILQIKEQKQ
ncbi:winged helix-turn-helix domain-containing protein [Alteromonas sp. ASW11-130]|uniref:winged helix-turn-helix domain-containing protein n=1 Tax=Alteromonas sp. ASW11-130 TaxID=3015775 RepID=UPI0022422E88|nr:winged helix-turn-helix domain-containing protein [Alteromonas sp. ASW11-130]MCW8091523.1 winged helix-turn-helix domain-containing protein [Alteromonas sp. ASW11-130]